MLKLSSSTVSTILVGGLIVQRKVKARTLNFYQANLDVKQKNTKERNINDVLVDCDALFELEEIDYLVEKLQLLTQKWPTSGNYLKISNVICFRIEK